jgi:hypothetical protein
VTPDGSTHHACVSWDASEARPDLRTHRIDVAWRIDGAGVL